MSLPSDALTLESLLEYEPFVRKVLRNMLVEEDQLPDLVQETWVRVLKRPPTQKAGVRAWLATVARNLARDQKRTRGHRQQREEAVARPESFDSVHTSHERLEMHQVLVQAVLELREPYKTVVVMRYYDGLSVSEIAKKVGRSPATVRSQMHRAHAQLKERLDRQYGERRAWMLIGVPWILSKEGPTSLGPVPGAESSAAAMAGWSALAATIAAVALWAPWDRQLGSGYAMENQGENRGDRPLVEALAMDPLWSPESQSGGERSAIVAETVEEEETILHLPVRVELDGAPVAGASVWAYQPLLRTNAGFLSSASHADLQRLRKVPAQLLDMGRNRSQVVTTNLDGEVTVAVQHANTFFFAQHAEGFGVLTVMNVPDRARKGERIEIQLDGDRGVFVEVVDPFGRPAPGVPVELLISEGDQSQQVIDCRITDGEGRVHFSGFRHVVGDHPTFVRTQVIGATNPIVEVPEDTHRQPIALRTEPYGGLRWHLDGHDPEQRWLGSAYLRVVGAPEETWTAVDYAHGYWPCVALHQELELRLESTEAGLTASWMGSGPVRHGADAQAMVRQPRGTLVEGRMLRPGEDGTDPLPAHRFDYRMQILDSRQRVISDVSFLPQVDGTFQVTVPLVMDETGPFHAEIVSLWATPQGNQRVRIPLASRPWNRARHIDLEDVQVRMVTHSIFVQLRDPAGQPLEGITVQAQPDRYRAPVRAVSDAKGQAVLDGFWTREVHVDVPPGQAAFASQPLLWSGEAKPTPWPLQRTGHLQGWILVDEGEEPGQVTCHGEGNLAHIRAQQTCGPDGSFTFSGLPPGSYQLFLPDHEGEAAKRVSVYAGKTADSGPLVAR